MPHFIVGSDIIDLELEVKSNLTPAEFLSFFKNLFAGKNLHSKHKSEVISLSAANRKQFAQELLDNSFLHLFTKKYYGSNTLTDLIKLLKKYD